LKQASLATISIFSRWTDGFAKAKRTKRLLISLLVLSLLLFAIISSVSNIFSNSTQSNLASVRATISTAKGSGINLTVELARTPKEINVGLMGRASLTPSSGMLFIFPDSGRHPFWMKNTSIPLSIAFIAEDGRIVDIQDMKPLSEEIIYPKEDHKLALEVPQGYFIEKGIQVGDFFTLNK